MTQAGERLIAAAQEARRMAGRGWHYCSDCERPVLATDELRCASCGSGRVVAGFAPSKEGKA